MCSSVIIRSKYLTELQSKRPGPTPKRAPLRKFRRNVPGIHHVCILRDVLFNNAYNKKVVVTSNIRSQ